MGNREKTLLCVWLAGILFIVSVIYSIRWPAILAAFFDWLPLPTGWMRMGGGADRRIVAAHAAVTLVAYAILVVWLVTLQEIARILFLPIWWSAVMIGAFIS